MREQFVGIKEAAVFLAVSTRTVKEYVSRSKAGAGKFPYYQDMERGKYYFKLSELDLWRFDNRRGA